ncbi:type VI secretion system protein TssA [Novosphingobium sp. ERN07]|uniref:type VI secretion system protein TssA n=1 Tax=Novosphingobium sp. ERN07 TaxID=2726187 RepID=UPI00145795BD|nr:type VI secretion system ImpA family N-terminal domain-containing protein [Novosphingobium sp. ERN07]NLR72735.1 type VI secretion system protein TssA [Novosphingobium sp. ERN07]
MTLDIAALVAPLSDEAPSGPDLSYDDLRMEIESAFERPVSEDGGESDVDWRKVIDQIIAQGAQTRDIWLPVYLIRAATFARRFDLLGEAAEWLATLLEERWADLHPQLDEYGFIGRKAPCESLTRISDFLAPLSRVPLMEHPRFGRFTGDDIERFAEQGASADGYGPFRATIEATDANAITALVDRFDALRNAFRRIDGVLTVNAEGDTATNFKPTYEKLDRYRNALSAVLPEQASVEAVDTGSAGDADDWGSSSSSGTAPAAIMPSGPAFSGSIRNRDDVVRALDAICAYYTAMEPGSPVPLLLQRAREWTGLDFMTVLQDLAPGGVDEATRVLHSRRTAAPAAEAAVETGSWGGETQTSSEW